MTNVFDFSAIKKLVDAKSPSVLVAVDAAILAGHPDLTRWTTSIQKPLFVLPGIPVNKREVLKSTPRSGRDSGVEKGVYKKGAGWFISAPAPDKRLLNTEFESLSFLVKTLGPADTGLLVLARELSQKFPTLPLILAVKSRDLYQAARFTGLNACLFRGFSRLKLIDTPPGNAGEAVDWDDILQDIQEESSKRVLKVELTLQSKQCAPRWIVNAACSDNNQVVVAEGTGIIHAASDIRFTWTLPYISWDLPDIEEAYGEAVSANGPEEDDTEVEEVALGTVYLDFGGLDNTISPWVYQALERKISDCASPLAYMEDMPTVQDPASVMKQWLIFDYAFQERSESAALSREALEEFEGKLRNRENLLNWARYWLQDRDIDPEEMEISFNEFLHALRSCWSIGDTISLDLRNDPAEVSYLKGEAEE